ncbi:hypothetical protein AWM68_14740 [Fictibacillus phosphorivorans]|uniref:Uncharacterized protein n=1 Tax=Fictibacillus phosphorivorans TaxID=1221500 RepID=A0A161RSL9_9BACL|nr:hypothetical protein [Fictibacillus phosphorivorans]KZE64339.1 hypothetical protein AWM68_14740 [Fictibacillus phosphorivorans]
MKTNEEAIWQMIKDTFAYFKYLTLSKETKTEMNINLVKEKYWFQQLVIKQPSILKMIEGDKEIREYFSSRKMVRKLLSDKEERQRFKDLLNDKMT